MLGALAFFCLAAVASAQNQPCTCDFLLYTQFNCEGTPLKTQYPVNFTAPPGVCHQGAIFDKTCHLTVYNESTSCNDGPRIPLPENGCVEVPQSRPDQKVKSFKTVNCGTGPTPPAPPPPPYAQCKCAFYNFNTTNCKGSSTGKPLVVSGKIGQCLGRGAEFAASCALELHNSSTCTGPITKVLPDDGCTNYRTSLGFNESFYTKCSGGNAPPPPPTPSTCKCYIGTFAALNCTGRLTQKLPLTGKVNACNNNVEFDANCNPTVYASKGCKRPIITLPPQGCSNIPAQFSNPNIKSIRAYGCGIAVDEKDIITDYITGKHSWSLDNEIDF